MTGESCSKNPGEYTALKLTVTKSLSSKKCEAPAKRSPHNNATYRNNVGRNMLRAFGHRVAMMCRDMLGAVGSSLQMVKLSQQHPTRRRVAKRTQHVAPNNVAICCVSILRSFGRRFRKQMKQQKDAPNQHSWIKLTVGFLR